LVDNGSTDGSPEKLSEKFPDIPLLKLPSNKGYGAGNNAGIRFAMRKGYNYLLILNNDVVVDPEFLEPMVQAMQTQPSVGVVTCKAFFQSDPARIYTTAGRFSKVRCSGIPRPISRVDEDGDASYISGCIMLVNRKVFDIAGLFDERFFMYFEDVEFSRRILAKFRIYYVARGRVYHKSGGGQVWRNFTTTYLYYTSRNRILAFQHESLIYRVYVGVYSLGVAIAKTLVIFLVSNENKTQEGRWLRIQAIWTGVKHGFSKRHD
jgi:GT2 family glycosyltransferase